MSSVGSVRKVPTPPPDAQVQLVGEEVGGYVLGELLTQGGMASVYLGKRVAPGGFEKTVAFKRLRPEMASQPAIEALFLREASLSAGLEHPSIVRTFDLAKLDGSYYLVMEYVRGGDLRLLLRRARRRGQRFSAAAALRIGRELLTALEYAHSRCSEDGWPLGLSHRDVSPANILISAEGEVKLSDFGIAQASADEGLGAAAGLKLRGKVGYMSPEQACGSPVDHRSDLFALAAVLYEVLTGKRLFIGQPGQPVTEIYQAAIVPPSQLCPDLPAACDAVLRKALATRKEDRYQNAREFYEALLDITRQHNLWLDHMGFAEHLRDICGPDASTWRILEERTGTAIIPSLGGGDDSDDDSGIEDGRALDESGALTGTRLPAAKVAAHLDEASGEIDHDRARPAGAATGQAVAIASHAEPLGDHVITVPFRTVPDKDLLPSSHSPDYTVPLPASALTEVDEPAPRLRPPSSGPGQAKDPGSASASGSAIAPVRASAHPSASASGSAIAPVRASAHAATRVIEHAPPPSSGFDLDAVTSPAELVDTTAPLAKATLAAAPELADETVPPALHTAHVALPSPLGASATNPMHRMPLWARFSERGRGLVTRAGGWTGIALFTLVLGGLLFGLWMAAGQQVWSWVWTTLQGQ